MAGHPAVRVLAEAPGALPRTPGYLWSKDGWRAAGRRRRARRAMASAGGQPARARAFGAGARRSALNSAHVFSDRQPQPMQPSSRSRSRVSPAMRRSSSARKWLASRVQSACVGARPCGSRASSAPDLGQGEAEVAGHHHHRQPADVGAQIAALAAGVADRPHQPLRLVEPQRRDAQPGARGRHRRCPDRGREAAMKILLDLNYGRGSRSGGGSHSSERNAP